MTDLMEKWLKKSGASGLDDLELVDFPDTGRGIRTLQQFEEGEKLLVIPHGVLWTAKQAHADPVLGPALLSARPSLSIDDTLATYILFVRSRSPIFDGLRSHVATLPARYTSSIFFTEAELQICAGSSLYTTTKHLDRQIEVDYTALASRLFRRHPELFPQDEFTIDDVCIHNLEDTVNQSLTDVLLFPVQMGSLHGLESCDGFQIE